MAETRTRWFFVVGAAAVLALGTCTTARAQKADGPVAGLIEESKKQQKKVEEAGKKLLEAGKAYTAAKDKPEEAELLKKYKDLRADYDKEVAALREIAKKLDEASKQDGQAGKDAANEAIRSLGQMLGELIAQVLGAFLGGMQPEERKKYLEASSKAVLGLPLSAEEIAALAKVPKPGESSPLFDLYKEYHNTPDWPPLRDKMVAAAITQLGKTNPAALALEAAKTAVAADKKAAQVAEAAKKPLTNGKFNSRETRAKFLEVARAIAPPEVVDELNKIEADE